MRRLPRRQCNQQVSADRDIAPAKGVIGGGAGACVLDFPGLWPLSLLGVRCNTMKILHCDTLVLESRSFDSSVGGASVTVTLERPVIRSSNAQPCVSDPDRWAAGGNDPELKTLCRGCPDAGNAPRMPSTRRAPKACGPGCTCPKRTRPQVRAAPTALLGRSRRFRRCRRSRRRIGPAGGHPHG